MTELGIEGTGAAAGSHGASALRIRPGEARDVPALTRLYNHYVRETPITFDLVEWTEEQRREWFSHYAATGRHRLLVAEQGGELLGYASSSRWRAKAAYDTTIETSIYCRHDAGGRGIGSALYAELFRRLEGEDVHRAVAGLTLPNDASLELHRRFGFQPVGTFREVGRKFGRYWDVMWMDKALGATRAGASGSGARV